MNKGKIKKEIAIYEKKGLSNEEASILAKWSREHPKSYEAASKVEARPLLDKFFFLYRLGYTCQEINEQFPRYPIQLILWARINLEWDKKRREYRDRALEIFDATQDTKIESLRFLNEIIAATHVKWRREIADYIVDPSMKPPSILPNNGHAYSGILRTMQEIIDPNSRKKGAAGDGTGDGLLSGALISVKIDGKGESKVEIKPATQEDIKRSLMEDTSIDVTPGKDDEPK